MKLFPMIYHNAELGGAPGGLPNGGTPPPPPPNSGALADNAPWYQKAGVSAEHHEWLAGKQFSDPSIAIASHRALESLVGRQRLAAPSGPEDTAALDAIYKTLGRPDKPEGYALKEGSKIMPEEFKAFQPIFHKHGASPALVNSLMEAYEARATAIADAKAQEATAREQREIGELEAAWASNHTANTDIASRAFRHLGLGEEETAKLEEALGYRRTMEIMHKIGAGMSESAFHQDGKPGSHGGAGNTLEGLQAQLSAKFADKDFMAVYKNHDPRVRAGAIKTVEEIQKQIAEFHEKNPQEDPRLRGGAVTAAKYGAR